jgi:TRAP-type C4-dicarboxylate transport system substrate-binding protein
MRRIKLSLAAGLIVFLLMGAVGAGIAAEPPKFKLRLQTHLVPEDTKRGFTKFAELMSAMSGGQIEITLFPVGAIVPMKDLLEAVGKGTIDIGVYAEGYWFKTLPITEVGQGLPFVFRDLEESKGFMYRKGFMNLLRDAYAKHNVYFFPYETYPIGLMTKKPIRKIDDLKGMKLRAYGTMADFLAKMKVATTFIPGGELYTALATGVVQGAHWGDAGPMYIMKFHEVLKNYMKPEPIVGAWNNMIINADLWKKFTPEQKAMIESAVLGGGMFWALNDTRILARKSLNEMVNKWQVKVVELPEPEIDKMRKLSLEMQNEIANKDAVCAKGIGMLRDYMKELGYEK